jgi:hypothetical protein
METSLLNALAGQHRSTVTKMARKYKSTVETSEGPRACPTVTIPRDRERKPLVARFSGPLLSDSARQSYQRPVTNGADGVPTAGQMPPPLPATHVRAETGPEP